MTNSKLTSIDVLASYVSTFIILENRSGQIDVPDLISKIEKIEALANSAQIEFHNAANERDKAKSEAKKLADAILEMKLKRTIG